MNKCVRSPKDKISTNGGEGISKGKLRRIIESEEPNFQDRVVHEVLLMILEPFFEATFSSKSHRFRPGRNPHTVIRTIRSNFAGYLWFINGDVSKLLDHVNFDVVMNCLQKIVKDRNFLSLLIGNGDGLGPKEGSNVKRETRRKRKF